MIHNITKLKHITDFEASKYTELDYNRMIAFESLEAKQLEYEMNLKRQLNNN